ncbi:MAG: DNA-processing protein DprA [Lachnospiraceae bacterium]|nr:DNA-processing protein DprA [Lachnospiraceae bacterium]
MEDALFLYWLGNLKGIGLRKEKLLLKQWKSPEKIYHAGKDELESIKGIGTKEVQTILSSRDKEVYRKQLEKLRQKKIRYISYFDENYPEKLRQIPKPPKHLYGKGELPDPAKVTISIVGARDCTCYGRDMARMFGYRLAKAGVQIVSGMAKGIDGWAHQGALEGGGKTFAVLGCGVEVCYPPVHRRLYDSIVRQGGILSEFAPYTGAKPAFFPMRNRIISGLADGILIVEAREKSGSLISADAALEQGKDVFVIPGRIGDELSVGCNRLICQGAIPVLSPGDILNYYGVEEYRNNIEETLSGEEKNILSVLGTKPLHTVQIAAAVKLQETTVFKRLLGLKEKKLVREISRSYFVRVVHEKFKEN